MDKDNVIPFPGSEAPDEENPNCFCGKHLGFRNHDMEQHNMAEILETSRSD